ncbi:MAG TPA: NACHT domain-containing protein [Streptosporangiaceae bacterium]|nr:NACHT domain-containing protein [Streptosporangiaceae bacterium]
MIGSTRRLTPGRRTVAGRRTRTLGGPRPRRRDRGGVDEPQRWWPGPLIVSLAIVTGFAVVVFLAWLGWSIYVVVHGSPSNFGQFDPDRRCGSLGFSCGAITNILTSVLLIALATFFLLWRIFGLVRQYRGRARADSRELVPTAGTILDDVVGRDELCQVVMADLHERRMRPHVLVGGVGTGKTAVLVRLTEMLADKHAIPVPVRLRDARETLDFEAMAQERFLGEVNQRLISLAEGETIWRRLRNDNRIVVLADGLEEALVGNSAEQERDNIIRAAIRKAHQQRLPLVIASRPHDPLRATVAAILALEPLSYEAALAYIGNDGSREDERRLAWIVETADVVEAPLYLQITRELKAKGLLDPSAGGRRGVVDTRGVDRSRLRLALLETWQRALISGYLREEVPLNQAERLAAFEHMSALACVGLKTDKLEIEFAELEPEERLSAEVQARLAKIDGDARNSSGVRNIDVRLAAAWAGQLDLVELRGQRVRFPHSLIQAYLGSRLLDVALADPGYCEQALKHPGPGREFLIAMVLRSRANDAAGMWQPDPAGAAGAPSASGSAAGAAAAGGRQARPKKTPARANVQQKYVDPLRKAAGKRHDNKVLDMYAAALEIDCGAPEPTHLAIADKIKAQWPRIHAQEPRTLDEGKLLLVSRFGDAARRIDDRRQHGEASLELPAYRQLYEIACLERSYPVKLAAAQEIGVGGDSAYQELSAVLAAPCPICHSERAERLARAEVAASRSAISSSVEKIISAWLAPMLVGSVGATGSAQSAELADQAQADLDQWLRHIGRYGRRSGEEDLDITLEIGIAQGFKYAANRRPANPDTRQELRMHLAEQALEMLKGTEYWFSQLTLIQALCLLSLSDEARHPANKHGAKPEAIVQHWLDVAGRDATDPNPHTGVPGEPHPFVREAAQLAVLALKTGFPQRYLWIDESGVVGKVGSRKTSDATTYRKHRLWIPPSAGWTALNGRAQQLVADVLLLLNLADRGDQPPDSERRLKRSNRHDLPPCITRYRPSLDPGLTVGTATSSAPGTSCVDGCPFELCPYPPKGTQSRMEMSEAFCRRQQMLLTRRSLGRRRAPWQEMRHGQLINFWAEMADRARGPRPSPIGVNRGRMRRRTGA